jgi:hypothetical protein
MDFIEINDSVDYENIGYVNENGIFENTSVANDVTNTVVGNPPQNLVDNQSFYRDFTKKNPQQQLTQSQRQPFPRHILKQNTGSQQQPQKKVTYDDILSSLSMKVVNGKLQIVRGDEAQPSLPAQMQRARGGPIPSSSSRPQNQYTQAQSYTKQSEFYNKFLQAQQQQQMVEEVEEEEVELTPEQIAAQQQYQKRLMMIQYIKNQQQRMRVGQVKSRKMKFV